MSWLRVDDEFPEHPKVLLLTDAALAFWLKVGCWLQRPASARFNGFIPKAMLPSITRKPADEAAELAAELVNATAGGMYEHGLWIECEGGYRVHDWDKYQPPPDKMTPQESARIAGQKSAEARREKYGSARPGSERSPNEPKPFGERSNTRSPNDVRDPVRPNDHRTSRTPVPGPDPVVKLRSKADEVDPKDLTGIARDDIPTHVNNPKPHQPDGDELSDVPPGARSSEPAPTQPRAAQAAAPPESTIEINPRSRAAVMALPIAERSRWLEANKDQADWAQPQAWPEVVAAIQAFYDSAGRAMPRLRHYKQDFAVQAMVSHYAADESVATVVAACRSYPKTESFRQRVASRRPPSAAWITVEVLRRAADDMADAETTALELAREKVRRESETQTASMVAKVEHLNELRDPAGKDWSRPRPIPLPARGIKALIRGGK